MACTVYCTRELKCRFSRPTKDEMHLKRDSPDPWLLTPLALSAVVCASTAVDATSIPFLVDDLGLDFLTAMRCNWRLLKLLFACEALVENRVVAEPRHIHPVDNIRVE